MTRIPPRWPLAGASLLLLALVLGAAQQVPSSPNIPIGRPPVHPGPPGAAAGQFTIDIDGAVQGRFKGEGTRAGSRDKLVGVRIDFDVKRSSHAPAATGAPIVISKEWGAASPQLLKAATTGETLRTVAMEFYRPSGSGDPEVFYTVTLTDAKIDSLRQYSEHDRFYEDIGFSYARVQIEHVPSKSRAEATPAK